MKIIRMLTPSIILIAIACLTSCGERENKKDAQAYINEVTRLYQEFDRDTAAIDAILNEGLAAHPDNIPLVQLRGTVNCGRGMLQECRADVLRMLELKPNLIEARVMICMLNELEGADRQNCDACYFDIVKSLEALSLSPEASQYEKISYKLNYVYVLLMARHPDAEKEKANFLSMTAAEPEAWIYRDMLENFDRERVLREILGQ